MQVRHGVEADAESISSLIRGLSHLLTLKLNGEGAEPFLSSIGEQAIRSYINAKNFSYLIGETESQLVGVVAIRDQSHLYHLFVDPAFQGQGLGRTLWSVAREAAIRAGNPGKFTVNSSPNAFPVYERFGFVRTGPRVESHGVAFIPMQLVVGSNGG